MGGGGEGAIYSTSENLTGRKLANVSADLWITLKKSISMKHGVRKSNDWCR